MRRPLLVLVTLLAGVAVAQNVSRVWLTSSAITREAHLSLLSDGGVRLTAVCDVPIQDGGEGPDWAGTAELAGAARTSALNLMDSATVKGTCRLR